MQSHERNDSNVSSQSKKDSKSDLNSSRYKQGKNQQQQQQQQQYFPKSQPFQAGEVNYDLAASTPNKFELAKKFTLNGVIEATGQVGINGQPPIDYLETGQFVDAKDQVNNWCVGQIVDTNPVKGEIKVHFDGWSERYDDVQSKKTTKLAPFRSHSRGYTGQHKVAYRAGWRLNPNHQVILEAKVKDIIATKFKCFGSPHECTQFVRGELFIFIDSILTMSANITSNDLPQIVEFMELVFQLILTWMEIFPLYYQSFKDCIQYPFLFCVDLPAAISQCGYELSEILGKIWGLCRRSNATFQQFSKEYIVSGPFARQDKIQENGLALSLTNVFGNLKGFQKIVQLIQGQNNLQFPLQLTANFLMQFKLLPNYAEKTFVQKFAGDVSQTLMNRLDNLTDTELKEVEKEVPHKIINVVEAFVTICQPNTKVSEVSEIYELRIAKKYLTSPFFEKKIRGMAEFKDIFIKVQNKNNYDAKTLNLKELPFTNYLTFPYYAEWMANEKILEYIFIENPHNELIKRSLELLYLRAVDDVYPLTPELINGIWECCTQKHDEIQRAAFQVVHELTPWLKINTLGEFWRLISQIKNTEVEEMHVDFLRRYTEGAFKALETHRKKEENALSNRNVSSKSLATQSQITNLFHQGKDSKRSSSQCNIDCSLYLSLDKFWEIGQEKNKAIAHKVREFALTCLIELLTQPYERPFIQMPTKIQFIQLALMNMDQSNSVYTSIEFLRQILLTFNMENNGLYKVDPKQPNLNDRLSRESIIQDMLKQGIFNKVISNAAQYQERARINLKYLNPQVKKEELHLQKLGGDDDFKTHQEYIDCFMNFIEFIIKNSQQGSLTFLNLSTLYDNYVLHGVTEYEAKKFFLFLTKENENGNNRDRRYLLNEARRNEVFNNIMCNKQLLDSQNMRAEGFACFKMLFINVNNEKRYIDYNQDGSFNVSKLQDLIGMETLWDIVIHCCDNKVLQDSRNFLVDLYLKSKAPEKQKNYLVQNFLQKLTEINSNLQKLQLTAEHQSRWRLNWVRLIQCYISRFDNEHIEEDQLSKYLEADNQEIPVSLEPDKVIFNVKINKKMRIWQLIIQIGKKFGMRTNEFSILTKNGPLSEQVYSDGLERYQISSINIQRKDEKILNAENPRRVIAQNKEFISRLISGISTGSDAKTKAEIISLVECLPVNVSMKRELLAQIQSIKDQVGTPQNMETWSKIFGWDRNQAGKIEATTFHVLTLLYDCLILDESKSLFQFNKESLIQEKKNRLEFTQIVIEKGGYEFLILFFNTMDKRNLESSTLRNKALIILIQIMPHFFTQKLYLLVKKQTDLIIDDLFSEVVKLVQSYINTVHQQQISPPTAPINTDKRILGQDTKMFELALDLMQRIILLQPAQLYKLYKFDRIFQTFEFIWTVIENQSIQKIFSQFCYEISKKTDKSLIKAKLGIDESDTENLSEIMPAVFLIKLVFLQFLPKALNIQSKTNITTSMFLLVNTLMRDVDIAQYIHLADSSHSVNKLISDLSEKIKQRPINEATSSSKNEDTVLRFLFVLMTTIMTKKPLARIQFLEKNEFICYLLNECLFMKQSKRSLAVKGQPSPPKCKTQLTRDACMLLLKELLIDNREGSILFIKFLNTTIYSNDTCLFWRTHRKPDWNVATLTKNERSITGFVGLKNIGCICYMNSIMQQLFMIPSFRKAILEVQDANINNEPDSQNVLYQIKRIFGGLTDLEKVHYNPKKFCEAFKDIDGSPIDPNVQKDVDEFFNPLIDKIENLIKDTKEEKVMKNLFYGAFANELICKDCPHQSEREEPFTTIQLQVKNKKSVIESLDSYIEGEMLEGDNAYYCDKCEKKRNTLKRQSIKRLPNVLFLSLKRFEFNYDTMTKFKVNDYMEFPMNLDMSSYCQEVISRNELLKKMDEKSLTKDDLNEDQLIIYNRQINQQYYFFKLKGIIVHNGTADSGHYYSYIQDREQSPGGVDDKWFCFNDSNVDKFDPSMIPTSTFGGEHENYEYQLAQHQKDPAMMHALKVQGRMKMNNAYILIYERENFIDQEKFREFSDDNRIALNSKLPEYYQLAAKKAFNDCRLPSTVSSQIQITPKIQDQILEKNRRFWLMKYIFNKQFLEQMQDIFVQFSLKEDLDYSAARNQNLQAQMLNYTPARDELEILKFQISFFITVAIRAQSRTQVPIYIQLFKNAMRKNIKLCIWFIETFTNQDIIKELLVECPVQDMARFTAGLLRTAMQMCYEQEQDSIMTYIHEMEQGNLQNYIRGVCGDKIESIRTKVINNSSQIVSGASLTPGGPPRMIQHEQEGQIIYTPSSQLDIITFKFGVPEKIPVCIALINSFLHYQGSPNLLEKILLSAQFWGLISHFADLGAVARYYLLKTGTLMRMLNISFENLQTASFGMNSAAAANFAQEIDKDGFLAKNVPLLQINPANLYILPNSQPFVETKEVMRERANNLPSTQSPFTFMIYTISNLVRSCQFVKPLPGQAYPTLINPLGSLLYELDKNEREILVTKSADRLWWQSSNTEYPLAKNATAKMFAHICFDDDQFSQKYIKEILKSINSSEFNLLKRYERPLLLCMQLQDQFQSTRIKLCINLLIEVFKKNITFWKFCDQLTELTYKLALRCRPFAIELAKQGGLVKQIESITQANPCFPVGQSKIKLFKLGNINWQLLKNTKNFLNEEKVEKIRRYSKIRLENLQTILKMSQTGEMPANYPDSDDDLYGHNYQIDEKVDVKYSKKEISGWHQAKVIFVLDEMVRVQTSFRNQNGKEVIQELWIETESYKITNIGVHTQNEKLDNFLYFQELFKLIEPAEATNTEQSSDSQNTNDTNKDPRPSTQQSQRRN